MGDIADMMINGDLDFYTGEYIGKGRGIPRTVDKSLLWEKDKNWKKVTHYLRDAQIKPHLHGGLIRKYADLNNIYYGKKSPVKKICFEILKNFDNFKEWLKINK